MVEADGLVWVSTSVGDVVAVDAVTGTVTHRIGTGMQLSGIAVANGRVWVAANREGLLLEIDPGTDSVAGQVMIGGAVRGVTAVGTDVWVAGGDQGRLVRVDAISRTVTGSTPSGPSPAQIASTPGGFWVTDRDNDAVILADPNGGMHWPALTWAVRPSASPRTSRASGCVVPTSARSCASTRPLAQ